MGKRGWAILAGAMTAAVVLVAALWLGTGSISAQEPVATPTPVPQGRGQGQGNCPCGLTAGESGRWGWQAYGQVEIVAEQLGMTVADLTTALQDGQSVADVAAEKGVALEMIVEAIMAPRREALAEKVTAGKLTQEQADTMLAQMLENVTARLQETGLPLGQGPAGRMMRAERMGWQMHGQMDIVAETLGMTQEDLLAALQGGQTVAQVAESKGVALETVVEALLAPRREVLAEKVAEGELTQAEADAKLAQMEENITTRLQQAHLPQAGQPGGMMEPGGMMGRGGMGGGRMGGGRMGGGMWGTTP